MQCTLFINLDVHLDPNDMECVPLWEIQFLSCSALWSNVIIRLVSCRYLSFETENVNHEYWSVCTELYLIIGLNIIVVIQLTRVYYTLVYVLVPHLVIWFTWKTLFKGLATKCVRSLSGAQTNNWSQLGSITRSLTNVITQHQRMSSGHIS